MGIGLSFLTWCCCFLCFTYTCVTERSSTTGSTISQQPQNHISIFKHISQPHDWTGEVLLTIVVATRFGTHFFIFTFSHSDIKNIVVNLDLQNGGWWLTSRIVDQEVGLQNKKFYLLVWNRSMITLNMQIRKNNFVLLSEKMAVMLCWRWEKRTYFNIFNLRNGKRVKRFRRGIWKLKFPIGIRKPAIWWAQFGNGHFRETFISTSVLKIVNCYVILLYIPFPSKTAFQSLKVTIE